MDKLISFMEDRFSPLANKISRNLIVASIQEAIMTALPLILVGSLVTVLSLFENIWPSFPDLSQLNTYSFGVIGLIVAFFVPYFMLEKKGIDNKKLLGGASSLSLFLMTIGPVVNDDGSVSFLQSRFGATGMLLAMLGGLVVGGIMILFSRISFFKDSTTMPDFIVTWFDSLIPITLILLLGWVFTTLLQIDVFNLIVLFFSPLSTILLSFPGFVFISFLQVFLYSFGISPWLLTPIVYPVYFQALAQNTELVAKGAAAINIATNETSYALVYIGGMGATFMLVFLMAFFAKSARLKAIGRASLVPSIFNINEPVYFGAPIVFNPFLMVPVWLNSIIVPTIAYFSMSLGFVSIPSKPFLLWYLPYPFASYLATGDWRAVIVWALLLVVTVAVWYPFFIAYDRQQLALEAQPSEASEPQTEPSGGAL